MGTAPFRCGGYVVTARRRCPACLALLAEGETHVRTTELDGTGSGEATYYCERSRSRDRVRKPGAPILLARKAQRTVGKILRGGSGL